MRAAGAPLALALLGLLAPASPAGACGGERVHQIIPGVLVPTLAGGRLPEGVLADFPARKPAVLRLGVHREGDRWEMEPRGIQGPVNWAAEFRGDGGIEIRLWSETAGEARIPIHYRPKGGKATDSRIIALVGPPEPPPPVHTLEVGEDGLRAPVAEGRPFRLRLPRPLPEGYRWEIGEAEAEGWGKRRNPGFAPVAGDPFLLEATAWGETISVVLLKRRDGFQPFPERLSIRLEVVPAPKC